jgi:hypothetical protein
MTAGQVPETMMTGITADISHICQFGWYDWVMYYDATASFPHDKALIELSLGPAAVATDFPEEDLTPEYDHMEGTADGIDHNHGDLEITPEVGDNYVGAKIMLP